MSYYQIWFAALETMLKERALVSDGEIDAGHAVGKPKPVKRVLSPDDVLKVLHRGGPTERETNTAARFKPGDAVRAKNINPPTHTRLPRYVRGHTGVIERVIGCHVFPDSNATRRRRKSAVALYRGVRRQRVVGRRRRPDQQGFGRRLGAVSGACMIRRDIPSFFASPACGGGRRAQRVGRGNFSAHAPSPTLPRKRGREKKKRRL